MQDCYKANENAMAFGQRQLIIAKSEIHLVKCRNQVSNVPAHEGFPWLEVEDMRGANAGVRARKHQKLQDKKMFH